MAVLKNARRERFAQLVAQGVKEVDAYERAGYARNYGNPSKLLAKPGMRERVAEIKRAAADRVELTHSWVIRHLMDNAERCMTAGEERNAAAANRALELLGKEIGMFKDEVAINHNYVARMPAPDESAETWEEQQRPLLPN